MRRATTLFLLLFVLALRLPAQMSSSNVYLFNLQQVGDTTIRFSNPRWLTAFNPNGYNDHPAFIENDLLFIASQQPQQTQPDIVALNLRDGSRARVTATQEGEYSPARMPDFLSFSAVRMEFQPGDTLLRLWQFPVNRQPNDNGKPVFKYLTNIGYYHWLNRQQVAVFLVGEPNSLGIADLRNDQVQTIATNVGRTFRTLPNGNLIYVQKNSFAPWQLMEADAMNNYSATPLITVLPGAEDFALLPDGTILMARGAKVFKYRPRFDENWIEVADFSGYDLSTITRMAVSMDGKIALVAR
jgi:hypothetical protein